MDISERLTISLCSHVKKQMSSGLLYPVPEHVVSQNVSMWFRIADLFAFRLKMKADEKHRDVSQWKKTFFPSLIRRGGDVCGLRANSSSEA